MKKILLSVLVLCAAAFLIYRLNTQAEPPARSQPQTIPAQQEVEASVNQEENALELKGEVVPAKVASVFFKVAGTLENGEANFQKGSRFRKNQLLFQVNNREAFLQMLADKSALSEKISALMPEIESRFPAEKEKWNAFTTSLGPATLIGGFPQMNPEEQKLVGSNGIYEAYQKIRRQEAAMADYFYIAPYDGVVLERPVLAGTKVRKNQSVAQIGKNGKLEIKCAALDGSYGEKDNVRILSPTREFLSKATYAHSSPTPGQKHLTDVYFTLESAQKLKVGQTVIIAINPKSKDQ